MPQPNPKKCYGGPDPYKIFHGSPPRVTKLSIFPKIAQLKGALLSFHSKHNFGKAVKFKSYPKNR